MQRSILFYINQIYDGGAERVMVNLANLFAENGYKSVLLTSFCHSGEYDLSEKVHRLSVEDEERKDNKFNKNFRRITFLRKTVKKYDSDIVVSFMTEPNVRMLIATMGLKVKRLISVRNDPRRVHRTGMGWFIGKIIFPMADACVFQTEEAKEWFPLRLQKKSRVIFNPVGDSFYHIERKPMQGRIVTCGRLVVQKNHKMLIEAFYEVQKKYPEVSLEIYGEGELRQELQRHIDNLGISDKAFLRGRTSNVIEILSKAEIFVLPSDYEGMPNALQEALAVGVPCISTDCPCGGPSALIDDGQNGKLCKPKDMMGLVACILELLRDREKMEAIGKAARNKAKMFSSNEIYKEWESYMTEVMGK